MRYKAYKVLHTDPDASIQSMKYWSETRAPFPPQIEKIYTVFCGVIFMQGNIRPGIAVALKTDGRLRLNE